MYAYIYNSFRTFLHGALRLNHANFVAVLPYLGFMKPTKTMLPILAIAFVTAFPEPITAVDGVTGATVVDRAGKSAPSAEIDFAVEPPVISMVSLGLSPLSSSQAAKARAASSMAKCFLIVLCFGAFRPVGPLFACGRSGDGARPRRWGWVAPSEGRAGPAGALKPFRRECMKRIGQICFFLGKSVVGRRAGAGRFSD